MSQLSPSQKNALAADESKRRAAARAAEFVTDGMRLGLGTGSTAAHFVAILGDKMRNGLDILGVPTSTATYEQAAALGIPLSTLDETPELDLTVDGADEFDSAFRLIKGGGGALLREKIVAAASKRMIVITDASKEVPALGRFPLPVEVDRFGLEATRRHVAKAIGEDSASVGNGQPVIALRKGADGAHFVTDGGHCILDCALGRIHNPEQLAQRLAAIPGVVEHGLFLGLASTIIIADPNGVRVIERSAHQKSHRA